MAQGMSRRHLFDNGYPVSCATLLAGAEVLLAISRQASRASRFRLAKTLLRFADTSERLTSSHVATRDSRENYRRLLNHAEPAQIPAALEEGAGFEPGQRQARQAPHRA